MPEPEAEPYDYERPGKHQPLLQLRADTPAVEPSSVKSQQKVYGQILACTRTCQKNRNDLRCLTYMRFCANIQLKLHKI